MPVSAKRGLGCQHRLDQCESLPRLRSPGTQEQVWSVVTLERCSTFGNSDQHHDTFIRLHPPTQTSLTVLPRSINIFQFSKNILDGAPFRCPEPNGFFPDPEQCDKYYECVGEVPEEKFCPDGLLFEASNPNNELCDYPFNVDCGAREYVRKYLEGTMYITLSAITQ